MRFPELQVQSEPQGQTRQDFPLTSSKPWPVRGQEVGCDTEGGEGGGQGQPQDTGLSLTCRGKTHHNQLVNAVQTSAKTKLSAALVRYTLDPG